MKTILPPVKAVAALCPVHDSPPDSTWRMTAHRVQVKTEDGLILYHTMTGEMLLLDHGEAADISGNQELRTLLADKCFLLPPQFSERKLVDEIREALAIMEPPADRLKVFTIFPTTDCNARCFYCYEMGRSRKTMTEQTAHDVAAFIAGKSKGESVTLRWFGGEPLFNVKAIDIITSDLRERGIPFQSRMISNGYLFDREMIRRAKECWNLAKIQVTLDGTEEVYNRTKAYIHSSGSAFQRVMQNVEDLLKAEITVQVRLNMDSSNADDLLVLTDQLAARFGSYSNCSVYRALLREYGPNVHSFQSDQESIRSSENLRHRMEEGGICDKPHLLGALRTHNCIADNDEAVMILPEGQLGKCEHCSEDHFIGSIYSDTVNEEEIQYFKVRRDFVSECEFCVFYPTCYTPKACASNINGCTALDRRMMEMLLPESVLNSYLKARNKDAAIEEEETI